MPACVNDARAALRICDLFSPINNNGRDDVRGWQGNNVYQHSAAVLNYQLIRLTMGCDVFV